mmetsp:Transcript_126313/g.252381  ORF Transcript_126313/g.252381 Transcript_126313/m.252381 type:complete len:209 (-) Transcript_126313:25-651(-)
MNLRPAYGAQMAFRAEAPPLASAGKNFIMERPRPIAASISVGVATPGITGIPRARHQRTTSGLRPGDTIKRAPASTAFAACAGDRIVPAPRMAPGTPAAIRRSDSSAAAVRKTTSTTGRPPATRASARGTARSASGTATTGIIFAACNCCNTSTSRAAKSLLATLSSATRFFLSSKAATAAPAAAPATALTRAAAGAGKDIDEIRWVW